MTFDFNTAKTIAKHYQFLIGKDFFEDKPSKQKITHILITPTDPKQLNIFMSVFNQTGDNQEALYRSGCNVGAVNVLLAHHDTWGGNIYHSDIDKFLTRNNLEKIYSLQTPTI